MDKLAQHIFWVYFCRYSNEYKNFASDVNWNNDSEPWTRSWIIIPSNTGIPFVLLKISRNNHVPIEPFCLFENKRNRSFVTIHNPCYSKINIYELSFIPELLFSVILKQAKTFFTNEYTYVYVKNSTF